MEGIVWIMTAAGVLIVLLGVLFYLLVKNKKAHEPDYYTFFVMGLCWTGAGIPLALTSKNWGFLIMGLIFMGFGLANKKKWKKSHKTWGEMDDKQKKVMMVALVILGALVLMGLVFFYLANKGVL
ncbi:TPA: hypothetical protein HA265_07110 [Candidatus Woesearchaeota archaeon]|nr:hypothetical protein [Candidatus Woesearchaeota archaeon]